MKTNVSVIAKDVMTDNVLIVSAKTVRVKTVSVKI